MRTGSLGLGLLGVTGCNSFSRGSIEPKKPNIVYILADDLGYGELGCYGQKKIKTPNIDKLCAEGIKFTDHYSGSAVCAPSRCNLMTGKHGGHAYVRNNFEIGGWKTFKGQLPLPENTTTIASLLKRIGYKTAAFGKWGLGAVDSTGDPLNLGFDRFFGYNCQRHAHNLYPEFLVDDKGKRVLEGNTRGLTGRHYAPQVISDEMLKWIRAHKHEPFFVYYPTVLPHLPLQVPQEYCDRYKGRWKETPYNGRSYLPHPTPRAAYAGMISFMDDQVGRLMELLKELDLDRDTIVMFTSDNGASHVGPDQVDFEFFESAGDLRGLKGSLYEGGIRAPMIARWPGKIGSGAVTDHISAQYDAMATICELSGADTPPDTDGISFLPTLLAGPKQRKHEYLFWDFAGYGGQIAVRMGKWKGIKRGLKKNPDNPIELYDLENDIGEENDLAEEYPEIAAKLEKTMLTARTKPEKEKFVFGKYRQES